MNKQTQDVQVCHKGGPYLNGMGTTLICGVVSDNTVFWAHSGDSRLYHLHEHHLTRISRDRVSVLRILCPVI